MTKKRILRVVPLPEGPREYGRGIAKGMRLSHRLLAERAKDKKREQFPRSPRSFRVGDGWLDPFDQTNF
jgi:hypothetical protein